MSRTIVMLWGLLTLAAAVPVAAEQAQDLGDYVAHYNALRSDSLPAQVAQAYDIPRSKNRAILNVTVLKKGMTQMPAQPVTAKVTATATNLNGQLQNLDVREIREGNAIYYIGAFSVAEHEVMNLEARIAPEGQGPTYTVRFRQEFFP